MRWAFLAFLLLFYSGGVIGSFEVFRARFACVVLKDIDAKTCGAELWIYSLAWPFSLGREIARWTYEDERERSTTIRK